MTNKKAELSISMIIMAAIGVLILVIIAFLVFKSGGKANSAVSCTLEGGTCRTSCDEGWEPVTFQSGEDPCSSNGGQCCKKTIFNS